MVDLQGNLRSLYPQLDEFIASQGLNPVSIEGGGLSPEGNAWDLLFTGTPGNVDLWFNTAKSTWNNDPLATEIYEFAKNTFTPRWLVNRSVVISNMVLNAQDLISFLLNVNVTFDRNLNDQMELFVADPTNAIDDRNAVRQLIEELGRNNITNEQAQQQFNFIVENPESGATKETIEEFADSDESDLIAITNNLNILLNQQNMLISNAENLIVQIQSGSLSGKQLEGQDPSQLGGLELRTLEEIALSQLEGIVTVSLPRNRQNIRNVVDNANQLNVILPENILLDIAQSEIETSNMINRSASIIDNIPSLGIVTIPDIVPEIIPEGVIDIVPDTNIPDNNIPEITPTNAIDKKIPTGALLLLAPLLFAEPKMSCCNDDNEKLFDTGFTSFSEGFAPSQFSESTNEETENQKQVISSMITGAFGGALFAEPFRIRIVFSDGSSRDLVVNEPELRFFQSNLGPGDNLIMLEDIGLADLETRVTNNERNLVIMGQDMTELGQIDVRQDRDIGEMNQRLSSQVVDLGDLITDVDTRVNTNKADADRKFIELGSSIGEQGSDDGGFLGGLLSGIFGGVGIGSIVVLVLIFFLVRGKL